ncbi:TPA: hypothetical protein IAA82_05915 [Candidatus Galligastranaerophilus gallistercoris]|nr:hypothetical protein [Candidatus Galligastranaerophilus gallistercoris]
MVNVSSNEFYFIGVSLASNSSHDSSISVIDRNKQLVYLNKVYFSDDIRLFFETSSFVQNSIVMVSLAPDESLLDGKWRIHSKNYKMLGDDFKINKNNWTNRLNERLKDLFLKLNDTKCKVLRCNINLLRQSYGLNFDYLERTSLDCKNFQAGLKIKYGFDTIPDNLLPASSLEAVLCALFAHDIGLRTVNTKEISEFAGLKVLNRV